MTCEIIPVLRLSRPSDLLPVLLLARRQLGLNDRARRDVHQFAGVPVRPGWRWDSLQRKQHRQTEVRRCEQQEREKAKGRGYTVDDREMISALGSASGFVAVLVLALYIHDPLTVERYSQPEWLWITVPSILYWIGRIWIIAHRGQMDEDPVVFAVTDKVSYLILVFLGIGVGLAI